MKKLLYIFLLFSFQFSFGQDYIKFNSKPLSVLTKDDLKGLIINEDKFKDVNFIRTIRGDDLRIYLAIGKDESSMNIVNKYSGEDWLFFEKVIVLTDSGKYEYEIEEPKREVYDFGVEEISHTSVNKDILKLLYDIVTSNESNIRLSGRDYYKDKKISKKEKEGISQILNVYNKLKD